MLGTYYSWFRHKSVYLSVVLHVLWAKCIATASLYMQCILRSTVFTCACVRVRGSVCAPDHVSRRILVNNKTRESRLFPCDFQHGQRRALCSTSCLIKRPINAPHTAAWRALQSRPFPGFSIHTHTHTHTHTDTHREKPPCTWSHPSITNLYYCSIHAS